LELEPRTAAPAHATGAVLFVPLAALSDDVTFRLRDEGDVAPLAASIGRLGQLVPIELRPLPDTDGGPVRYQLVAGFRRVAALRLLMRDRVLARVHARLEADDAWALALAPAALTEPLLASELGALRERVAALPASVWADEALESALARAPVEPAQRERFLAWLAEARPRPAAAVGGEGEVEDEAGSESDAVEVTAEELVEDLTQRLWGVNQDLAVAADAWDDLPGEGRRVLLEQARWVAQLVRHLEGGR
jgi:ParB-like chromosome segregation protein Spo0J